MLQSLIAEIIALFESQFTLAEFSSSPLPENCPDLPAIAVYAGLLNAVEGEANQPLQPRRVPVAQTINLSASSRGPFPLDHRPLKASLSATHTVANQTKQSLVEPVHFVVERASQTITFTEAAPDTGSVLVNYDFTGLALVQEFEQALFIESRAADLSQAEHIAALAASIVLTAAEELARRASSKVEEPHAGHFRASTTISEITLTAALPGKERYTLNFAIQGQLKMVREMV